MVAPYYADMAQRVVIVEDEEDIAFPLVRTLEREGYDVQWLDSGQKALDDIQSSSTSASPTWTASRSAARPATRATTGRS